MSAFRRFTLAAALIINVSSWHTLPIRCAAGIMSGYRGTFTVSARHPGCVLVTPDQTKLLRGDACGMRATFFGIRGR